GTTVHAAVVADDDVVARARGDLVATDAADDDVAFTGGTADDDVHATILVIGAEHVAVRVRRIGQVGQVGLAVVAEDDLAAAGRVNAIALGTTHDDVEAGTAFDVVLSADV